MKYTKYQIKAMNQLRMSKVIYRSMWVTGGMLGYTSKGKRHYEINIADDIPNNPDKEDCKSVVLLHELGHQIYGHFDDVDIKKEMKDIKSLFESNGIPYSYIRKYGGPHSFINIAMDLYINSTFLTPSNCNLLLNNGFNICTLKNFGFEYQYDFRDYYQLMIDKIKDNKKESENKNESDQNPESDDNSENNGCGVEDEENENGLSDEAKKAISDLMKDFVDTVSSLDDSIDEDIQNEIYNENYISGNMNSDKDNIIRESKVENYIEISYNTDIDSFEGPLELRTVDRAIVECDKDEAITKFLSSIVNFDMNYKSDSIRRYNTGTRRNNSGILYSSMRRKNSVNNKKLGILIDCSSSMNSSSLIKAIKSLKDSMNVISSESVVIAWDFDKRGEWKISDIPDTMPLGYWTDLSKGVDYLNDLDCSDIIIYSDMATDLSSFTDSLTKFKGNIHSIIVGVNNYLILKSMSLGKKILGKMSRYICIKNEEEV